MMTRSWRILAGVMVLSCSAAFAASTITVAGIPVTPVGNIEVGGVEVHPVFGLAAYYDDNIYLASENRTEESDQVAAVEAGAVCDMLFNEDSFLEVAYKARFTFYNHHPKSNAQEQAAHVLLNMDFGQSYLRVKNTFEDLSSPAKVFYTYNAVLAKFNRIEEELERQVNVANVVFGSRGGRAGFEIEGNSVWLGFRREIFDTASRLHNGVTLRGLYEVGPKVDALLEYTNGWVRYKEDANNNSEYRQARVGLRGELTPKLVGSVKAGYRKHHFDGHGYNSVDDADYSGGVYYADLAYALSEKTALSATYARESQAALGGINFFTLDSVALGASHLVNEKVKVGVDAFHSWSKDSEESVEGKREHIKRMGGSVGVSYAIQENLEAGVKYELVHKDSNLPARDYNVNRVFLQLAATF